MTSGLTVDDHDLARRIFRKSAQPQDDPARFHRRIEPTKVPNWMAEGQCTPVTSSSPNDVKSEHSS